MSPISPLVGKLCFVPCCEELGPPHHKLCSKPAHLWGNFDFVPRCEAQGNPKKTGVISPICPLAG